MRNSANRQMMVVSSPKGPLRETHIAMRTGLMPELRPGQVLVRVHMLSIDPILRFLFDHDSPLNSRLKPGDVMGGWGMCEVVDPNGTALPKGTIAWLWCGWQDYFAVDAVAVQPVVDDGAPMSYHLGLLGSTGLAGYHGVMVIGQPRAGQTVLVSAAAGATGSIAAQLARVSGAHVVGVAGSADKLRYLIDNGIADAAVSHRSPRFAADLRAACPDGIDLFVDGVGGSVLEHAYPLMNILGKIVICGAMAAYDGSKPDPLAYMDSFTILMKRISLIGFRIMDEEEHWPAWRAHLLSLVAERKIKVIEDVTDGLENAPTALVRLLAGDTIGKAIVKL